MNDREKAKEALKNMAQLAIDLGEVFQELMDSGKLDAASKVSHEITGIQKCQRILRASFEYTL